MQTLFDRIPARSYCHWRESIRRFCGPPSAERDDRRRRDHHVSSVGRLGVVAPTVTEAQCATSCLFSSVSGLLLSMAAHYTATSAFLDSFFMSHHGPAGHRFTTGTVGRWPMQKTRPNQRWAANSMADEVAIGALPLVMNPMRSRDRGGCRGPAPCWPRHIERGGALSHSRHLLPAPEDVVAGEANSAHRREAPEEKTTGHVSPDHSLGRHGDGNAAHGAARSAGRLLPTSAWTSLMSVTLQRALSKAWASFAGVRGFRPSDRHIPH